MVAINFSSLTDGDVAQIALQRTKHLKRYPIVKAWSYQQWLKGNTKPLLREASRRREIILRGVMADIEAEFNVVADWLGDRSVKRMMDIGCGHALLDLRFWEKFKPHIHLVDIESTPENRHDYHQTGSGYASLESAKRLLIGNGVPHEKIRVTNPQKSKLEDADLDLIISTISAGFHYPISTYTDFALVALKPGGLLIFDARDGTGQEDMLIGFSSVEVVAKGTKHKTLAAVK